MAMKKADFDTELLAQCVKQAAGRNWELPGAWDATDNAAVAVRTILSLSGDKENLADDEHAVAHRKACIKALLPLFEAGAPVNFRRTALVVMEIAPKMETGAERKIDRPV